MSDSMISSKPPSASTRVIASSSSEPSLEEVRRWPEFQFLREMPDDDQVVRTLLDWLKTKDERRNAVAFAMFTGLGGQALDKLAVEVVLARGNTGYCLRLLAIIERIGPPFGLEAYGDLQVASLQTRNEEVRARIKEVLIGRPAAGPEAETMEAPARPAS